MQEQFLQDEPKRGLTWVQTPNQVKDQQLHQNALLFSDFYLFC